MRTGFVSTASLLNTPRTGIQRMQSDLARLNNEVITGRMADAALNLGASTGRSITLHIDTDSLAALGQSNQVVSTRLAQTQTALGNLLNGANGFLKDLVTNTDNDGSPATIKLLAQSALSAFVSGANASDGRSYLFGGINSAVAPIATDGGPEAAVDAAFLAKFGISQDDPAVADIDPADMADFLDNEFAALFDDPNWATWSSAADKPISNRISATETVDTSVSANETAMRKLAMVYTMVAKLGTDKLGAEARQTVLDKATEVVGGAISDLTATQARIGTTQNRIKEATERLQVQQTTLETSIAALEGVDPAEAKVRIDTLSMQIQMSYSLTAKLLQLSILNYV